MTGKQKETFPIDNGGRRRINDRRFKVSVVKNLEQRTGLHRRSGWDRRVNQLDIISGTDRRSGFVEPTTA